MFCVLRSSLCIHKIYPLGKKLESALLLVAIKFKIITIFLMLDLKSLPFFFPSWSDQLMKYRSLRSEEKVSPMQPLPALRAAPKTHRIGVLFMRSKVTRHLHRLFAVTRWKQMTEVTAWGAASEIPKTCWPLRSQELLLRTHACPGLGAGLSSMCLNQTVTNGRGRISLLNSVRWPGSPAINPCWSLPTLPKWGRGAWISHKITKQKCADNGK